MQIKRQTDQAIRILVHLSNERQAMVGKELAGLVGVSDKYIPHIMQQLRKAGLISSSSGTTGGYVLATNAKKITLLDVMSATGDLPQISCYTESEMQDLRFGTSDGLWQYYNYFQKFATRYFSSLTIWDLSKPDRLRDYFSKAERLNKALETNMQIPEGDCT